MRAHGVCVRRHAPHLKRVEYHGYVDFTVNRNWDMRKPFEVCVTTMDVRTPCVCCSPR